MDQCERKHYGRGWCEMHYRRWLKHGDAESGGGRLPLAERLSQRLKPQGDCLVWTGSTDCNGYGHIWTNRHTVGVHRVAYELAKGPIPEGLEIDHLCRNKRCVRLEHLDAVTSQVNNERQSLSPEEHLALGLVHV